MAYGAQLPVRLDPEIEERLKSAAKNAGTTKSAIIRLLATTFVNQCVSDDGTVQLPPDWKDLLIPAARRIDRYPCSGKVSDPVAFNETKAQLNSAAGAEVAKFAALAEKAEPNPPAKRRR